MDPRQLLAARLQVTSLKTRLAQLTETVAAAESKKQTAKLPDDETRHSERVFFTSRSMPTANAEGPLPISRCLPAHLIEAFRTVGSVVAIGVLDPRSGGAGRH